MTGLAPDAIRADRDHWGRVVETAVGAHLLNTADRDVEVGWWRAGDREVDFVLSGHGEVLAIEVASGRRKAGLPGLEAFRREHPSRTLLIGAQGLPLATALGMTSRELLSVSGPT